MHPVRKWSAESVPQASRVDYWMNVISQAIWPVSEWSVGSGFSWQMEESALGPLSTVRETIEPHRARRTQLDVARSTERCCQLFVSLEAPWGYRHRGFTEMLAPGDVVMIGDDEHETSLPQGFNGVIIKCPTGWMDTWLPDAEPLMGRRIAHDSRWGRVLSPLMQGLTPQFAAASPLPHAVLCDQLGAMLTLIAGEGERQRDVALFDRIRAAIKERCSDAALTASHIAMPLGLPLRVFHGLLASQDTTFLRVLHEARVAGACSLLRQQAMRHSSLVEIGRAAGFSNAAHFTRVFRQYTGQSPAAFRRLSS
jgi:AraC family transcriptional activator of tynA and feaB